ncbi:MAG TPA: hypothetical protein VF691_18905, partial [Cytophagaceae bacterium]
MRRSTFLLICFILSFLSHLRTSGQYFSSGQDPANIKWKQISNSKFQIIFPEDFSKEAVRLAAILKRVYEYDGYSLNHRPKKISIILHTRSTEANAFVTWAPRRAEFYTIPSQEIYAQEWLTQLTIHEMRHVVQIDKLNQGFTKILSLILGEQGTGAIAGLFLPLWFLEGDAIAAETALSNSGRGRLPSFEMPLKALTLEKGLYSYEKSIFGSYKDFVPDHYHIGYLLVAEGRKAYGTRIWEHSIDNVANKPYLFTPFSNSIKKITLRNKWRYYKGVVQRFDSVWHREDQIAVTKNYQPLHPLNKKTFTSYRYPQYLNDTTVIAEKSGLGEIGTFVSLSNSKEVHLFTPGIYYLNRISANQDFLAWHENLYHKRWENALGSKIILFDLKNKRRKRLSPSTNLFSPSLSPDSKFLVAVKSTSNNLFTLVTIDVASKKILKEISLPGNEYPINPVWSEADRSIICVSLGEKGKSLLSINYDSGKIDTLIEYSFRDISQPAIFKNYVVFHGTYNGKDNVFAVNRIDKRIYQVTFSKYGAFDPAVSPNKLKLAFSDYTPDGYKVCEELLDSNQFVPLVRSSTYFLDLADTLASQERPVRSINMDSSIVEVKPYSKLTHLLNVHSWAPAFVDINSYTINPGAVILSQNKL